MRRKPWQARVERGMRVLCVLVLVVAVLVLLFGCSATGGAVAVSVPVPVECKEKEPDRPSMPTDALVATDSLHTKATAALAEIEIREGYEGRLVAALRACLKPISQ